MIAGSSGGPVNDILAYTNLGNVLGQFSRIIRFENRL